MKATIRNSDLLAGLKRVIATVERRNTIPILSNVLLVASADVLRIKATDLDVAIETSVPAEVESEGAITVSAALLKNISDKIKKDADVKIELNAKDVLLVSAGRSRFQLQTLPASDFPTPETPDSVNQFDLTAGEIAEMFGRSKFAISTEATRYYLNGVYLHGIKDLLIATATDGHRLAKIEMAMPDGGAGIADSGGQAGVIVPQKTVDSIIEMAKGVDKLAIGLSPTRMTVASAVTTLTSKLIDGTFPDYARVIPAGNDKVMKGDCAELMAAVDRVTAVSSEKGRAVKLSLVHGTLTLSVSNPDAGTAQEEMEVEWPHELLEIGCNSAYLGEILANAKSDSIEISLSDSASPMLIRGAGQSDALFICMPMRVT
jgi:DNA polymerase III subunit beta